MRTRLLALLFAALAFLTACGNTVDGLQEDANNNINEAEQELEGDGE